MSKCKESKTMEQGDETQHLDSVATQHGIISLSTLSNLPRDYFQEANGGTAEQEPGSASISSSSTKHQITSSVGRGNSSDKRRKLTGRLVSLYESSGSSSDNSNSAEKIEDDSTNSFGPISGSGRAGSSCSTSSSYAPPSSEDSFTYRDYSDANEAEFGMHSNTSGSLSFPAKLYRMLEQIEKNEGAICQNLQDVKLIISWQPHGRCFKVHDIKAFENEVLPHFFPQQRKYASFRRQLSIYGFKRLLKTGPDQNGYYHEMFLRGKSYLCRLIPRVVKKQNAFDNSLQDEPDFSKMKPMPPLLGTGANSNTMQMNCSETSSLGMMQADQERKPVPKASLLDSLLNANHQSQELILNLLASSQNSNGGVSDAVMKEVLKATMAQPQNQLGLANPPQHFHIPPLQVPQNVNLANNMNGMNNGFSPLALTQNNLNMMNNINNMTSNLSASLQMQAGDMTGSRWLGDTSLLSQLSGYGGIVPQSNGSLNPNSSFNILDSSSSSNQNSSNTRGKGRNDKCYEA